MFIDICVYIVIHTASCPENLHVSKCVRIEREREHISQSVRRESSLSSDASSLSSDVLCLFGHVLRRNTLSLFPSLSFSLSLSLSLSLARSLSLSLPMCSVSPDICSGEKPSLSFSLYLSLFLSVSRSLARALSLSLFQCALSLQTCTQEKHPLSLEHMSRVRRESAYQKGESTLPECQKRLSVERALFFSDI